MIADMMTVAGFTFDPQKICLSRKNTIISFHDPVSDYYIFVHSLLSRAFTQSTISTVAMLSKSGEFFSNSTLLELDSFGSCVHQRRKKFRPPESVSKYFNIPGIYAPILDLAVENGLILPEPNL